MFSIFKNFSVIILNRMNRYRYRRFWKVNFNGLGIRISSVDETFKVLSSRLVSKESTVYLRFGDGEVNLINGKKHRNQIFERGLKEELIETFSLSGAGVVKGLPIHSEFFGKEEFMGEGVHLRSDCGVMRLLSGCFEYFIGEKIHSSVPIHYLMVYEVESVLIFFKEIKLNNPFVVCGNHNDKALVEQLLSPADVFEVPDKNAYSVVDKIECDLVNAINNNEKEFNVVVFSCGVLAKVLSHRLWLRKDLGKLYLLDLGSVLDVFHGRDKWTWVREANLDESYVKNFLDKVNN